MNDILFEILKAVVILVIVLIMRYAIPYTKEMLIAIKYDWLVVWVEIAVKAAEQTFLGDKKGKEKKEAVVNYIKMWLDKKHIDITDAQLDNLIESIVYELNNEKNN